MIKLKTKKSKVLLVLLLAVIPVIFTSSDTYAEYNTKSILQRTMTKALMTCYDQGYITQKFAAIGDYRGPDSLSPNGADSGPFAIPSGSVFSTLSKSEVNCKQIIAGDRKVDSAFSLAGHPAPSSSADAEDFLINYAGYKKKSSEEYSKGKCLQGQYEKTTYSSPTDKTGTSTPVGTNPICVVDITDDGIINVAPYIDNKGEQFGLEVIKKRANTIYVDQTKQVVKIAKRANCDIEDYGCAYPTYEYTEIPYKNKSGYVSWETFRSQINDAFGTKVNHVFNSEEKEYLYDYGTWTKTKTVYTSLDEQPANEVIASYHLEDHTGIKVASNLLGVNQSELHEKLRITAQEQVHLYMYYLTDLYKGVVDCSGIDENAAKANGYSEPIKWFKTGETAVVEGCYVTEHRDRDPVNGLTTDQGGTFEAVGNLNYDQLIEYFKNLKITELDNPAGSRTVQDPDTDPEERAPDCHTGGASLAWILCPVISASAETVEKVYEDAVEPYLSIDAVLFDTNNAGGAAVYDAWSHFQGFANLAFVLVFIFVIFSQLTGVGIDNYGIKKILPKLIIGAVLINISFLICQLSVDTSNILGSAVKGLFKNMGGDISADVAKIRVNLNQSVAQTATNKFPVGGYAVVGLASVLGISAFHAAGFAIIIPALLALVSLVISILFLFIMLSIRQAVAVILVVVSPLAFAAYILPNTKKFVFDKWYGAFKGILIAYPICSALVFGGDLVSKILLYAETGQGSTELTSLGIVLSAASVAVAPIFFIPGMIKKGLNGLNGLGDLMDNKRSSLNKVSVNNANERLQASRLTDYQRRRKESLNADMQDRQVDNYEKMLKGTGIKNTLAKVATGGILGAGLEKKVSRKGISGLSRQDRRNFRRYNDALNQRNEKDELAYGIGFENMTSGEIQNELTKMADSGVFDTNLAVAGLKQLGARDTGEMQAAFTAISDTPGFKHIDSRGLSRVAEVCRKQGDNPYLQAWAKDALKNPANVRSLESYLESNDAKNTIAGMGDSAFAGLNKDTIGMILESAKGGSDNNKYGADLTELMTAGQLGNILGSSHTGKELDLLGQLISGRNGEKPYINDAKLAQAVQSIAPSQLTNVDGDTFKKLYGRLDNLSELLQDATARVTDAGNKQALNNANKDTAAWINYLHDSSGKRPPQ